MKGRLVAFVGVVCIASLIVSGAYAKGKPDKPAKPGETTTELIVFEGDLEGSAVVEGCCPNAGPFPAYELTVIRDLGENQEVSQGTYSGYLFLNFYGNGRNREYVVRFWGSSPSGGTIDIEIIGGLIDDDKRNKRLTVTFVGEDCVDRESQQLIEVVTFTLVRTRL